MMMTEAMAEFLNKKELYDQILESGNKKDVYLIDVMEEYHKEQLALFSVVGQSEQFTPKQLWKMAQKYNADDFIQMVKEIEG